MYEFGADDSFFYMIKICFIVPGNVKQRQISQCFLLILYTIHKGGPIFTRVGRYSQGWADNHKGGPIFTRVGRYLQGWADIHKGGPIFTRVG